MIVRLLTVLWLTTVWVLLWGSPTLANIASGALIAAALTWGFPVGRSANARYRPLAILRFGAWFAQALVVANVTVAREILRPRPALDQGIIAVQLRSSSQLVTAFVANAISLTPGTLTVEVVPEPDRDDRPTARALAVHSLTTSDEDAVRVQCAAIEALVVAAFGTDEDRRRLEMAPVPPDGMDLRDASKEDRT